MELPPTLCVARTYEASHPRPDLEEFIAQYRKAGGDIDFTVYEGEGEGLLSDPSAPTASPGAGEDEGLYRRTPGIS